MKVTYESTSFSNLFPVGSDVVQRARPIKVVTLGRFVSVVVDSGLGFASGFVNGSAPVEVAGRAQKVGTRGGRRVRRHSDSGHSVGGHLVPAVPPIANEHVGQHGSDENCCDQYTQQTYDCECLGNHRGERIGVITMASYNNGTYDCGMLY